MGQALGAPGARQDAQLDLGLTEFGIVSRQDEIAHHGKLRAAAEGESGHSGDNGLAHLCNALPLGNEVPKIGVQICVGLHFLHIGARGKSLFRAGQNNAADLLRRFCLIERGIEIFDQLNGECIQRLRTIEPDEANRTMCFGQNSFICHGARSQ